MGRNINRREPDYRDTRIYVSNDGVNVVTVATRRLGITYRRYAMVLMVFVA